MDGRSVSLFLAREVHDAPVELPGPPKLFGGNKKGRIVIDQVAWGNLQLLAMVRGGIALKLLEFSEDGLITEDGLEKTADRQTLTNLLQTLTIQSEQNRQLILRIKEKFLSMDSLYLDDERNLRGYVRRGSGLKNFGSKINKTFEEMRNAVAKEFGKGSAWYGEAGALLSNDDKPLADLLACLDVKQKFNSYLGRGNTRAERLVAELGGLVTTGSVKFSGILEKKKAGTTVTNVYTTVQLSNGNKQVRVLVKGRPIALEDDEPAVFFDETLRMDAHNSIPADKLKELADTVGAICLSGNSETKMTAEEVEQELQVAQEILARVRDNK